MTPTPPPGPVLVSTCPRDVPAAAFPDAEGVAEIHAPDRDGAPVTRLQLGEMQVLELELAPGTEFTVVVSARHVGEDHRATYRFRATGDEADVAEHTVGPGLRVERGRWGRRSYHGFEFGVLVMGAVRLDR